MIHIVYRSELQTMNKPESLKEYLERVSLQRKKEFFMLNDQKNIPNPISLNVDNKIDQLILQILEYVKHLIGEGPLFTKFQYMMQHLHKTFMRELSQFHTMSISTKINSDKRYIDEVKKANERLTSYIEKCQLDQEEASKKLNKITQQNQFIKAAQTKPEVAFKVEAKKIEIEDNFDEEELVVDKPGKVEKLNWLDFSGKKKQPGGINLIDSLFQT